MPRRWRVLVTRPEPGASATAALLGGVGFEPVLLPLSETRRLDVPDAQIDADAVAATSAAALRHAPPGLLARLAALPCVVVGERTEEAAREAGFADVVAGPGDAAALARTTAELMPRGSRVAYLCGRVRLPDFEAGLGAAGFVVVPIETYDTLPIQADHETLGSRLAGRPVDAVLVYSAQAGEAVRSLVQNNPAPFASAQFVCISCRAAAALGDLRDAKIVSATEPNEQAMIALLRSMADAEPSRRPFSAQAAMLREDTGTTGAIDRAEPGMVKTTRVSQTGRDPVTIDLTAEERSAAPGSDAAGLGSQENSREGVSDTGSSTADDLAAVVGASEESPAAPQGVGATGGSAEDHDAARARDVERRLSSDRSSANPPGGSDVQPGQGASTGGRNGSAFGRSASGQDAAGGSRAAAAAHTGADAASSQMTDDPAKLAPAPIRRAYRGTAFLAGLLGGLLVLVIAGALQFAGLLPSPRTASAPPAVPEVVQAELAALRKDVAELDGLRQEIARLQENATTPSEAVQRLTASLDEVRTELGTLRDRPGGAAVDLGPLDARLTLLEKAVADLPKQDTQALTALGERVAGVEALVKSSGETGAASETRLAGLEQGLQGLEQTVRGLTAKVDAQAGQPAIARSIAASALKAAIDRGAPFRAELETLAAIVSQSPDLTALQAHAEKGVPTEAQIGAEMPAAANAMIAADQPPDQNAGFFDRLLDSAQSMVEVRPIGAVAGTGVPETVARMEVAVNGGDLAAALAEYETLPAPAKAAGATFADKIRARVEAIKLADRAIAAAMAAG